MAALPVPLLFRCVMGGVGDFCIERDVTLIGRQADCNIVLDHPVVSAHHGTLKAVRAADAAPGAPAWRYLVTDHSRNGVWVNKSLIGTGNTVELALGDTVTLCRTGSTRIRMQFVRGADGARWEGSPQVVETPAAVTPVPTPTAAGSSASPTRVLGGSGEGGSSNGSSSVRPRASAALRVEPVDAPAAAASGGSTDARAALMMSQASGASGATSASAFSPRGLPPGPLPPVPLDAVYAPPGADPHADYDFAEDDAHKLGSGAYAVVYKGKARGSGQDVAIKRIAPQGPGGIGSGVNPLEEEVRILASLSHPNIVQLYRVYAPSVPSPAGQRPATPSGAGGYTYLVQERVAGGELFDKVLAKSRFPEAHARGLFKQMLMGVAYLHSRGVVHRDLKPENILLQPLKIRASAGEAGGAAAAAAIGSPSRDPYGDAAGGAATTTPTGAAAPGPWKKRWQVKITDFGMSRMMQLERRGSGGGSGVEDGAAAGAGGLASRPTAIGRFNTVVGTEAYLAPELRVRYEQSSFDAVRAAVRVDVRRRGRALAAPGAAAALQAYLAAVDEDVEALQAWEEQEEAAAAAREGPAAKRPRLDASETVAASPSSARSPRPVPRDLPQPPVLPEGMQRLPSAADYIALSEAAERGYDGAVDSWSLGVVLYICLVGEMPFYADHGRPPAIIQQLTSFWKADHPAWDELSPLAKELVAALLHPNPKLRLLPADALAHPWITGEAPSDKKG